MPRSAQEIIAHADKFARAFEDYEPRPEDDRDPEVARALRDAVTARAEAEAAVIAAVARARTANFSWAAIGALLGTSGEAARQRYAPPHVVPHVIVIQDEDTGQNNDN